MERWTTISNSKEWSWQFAPSAHDQFDGLGPHVQDRIVSKLNEIIDSECRGPDDFLEPLAGGPFSKRRIGQYRLGWGYYPRIELYGLAGCASFLTVNVIMIAFLR